MYVFTYEHAPIERTIYRRQVKDSNVRTMYCSCSRKLTFCWIWQQKKRLQHHFEHVHTAGDHDDGDHGADEHRWL